MAIVTALDEPAPALFRRAVSSMQCWRPPRHIDITEITAPAKIAPFSFALAALIDKPPLPLTQGRLILLHDPAGHEAWHGTMRLVTYLSVDLPASASVDGEVAPALWSRLLDGLTTAGATFTAAGGTTTATVERKFGELANRTERHSGELANRTERHSGELANRFADTDTTVELRASWTPRDQDLSAHMAAWGDLLAAASGLPPQRAGGSDRC